MTNRKTEIKVCGPIKFRLLGASAESRIATYNNKMSFAALNTILYLLLSFVYFVIDLTVLPAILLKSVTTSQSMRT